MRAVAISLLVLVVACYAAVATAYAESRRHREPPPRWARVMGPLSVAAHLVGLLALSLQMERSPFANASQSLSFLAFSLAGLYVLFQATSRVMTHGGGFYAVAASLAALSVPGLVEGDTLAWTETGPDVMRSLHVGLSLLAAAAILAGGLLGIGYLGQYRRVKHAALKGGLEGPSLSGFEKLSRIASLSSLVLLVPSAVLGSMSSEHGEAGPSTVTLLLIGAGVALMVILMGATFLWWRRPRRGALASWMLVIAALVMIVAFVVAHPLLTGAAQ